MPAHVEGTPRSWKPLRSAAARSPRITLRPRLPLPAQKTILAETSDDDVLNTPSASQGDLGSCGGPGRACSPPTPRTQDESGNQDIYRWLCEKYGECCKKPSPCDNPPPRWMTFDPEESSIKAPASSETVRSTAMSFGLSSTMARTANPISNSKAHMLLEECRRQREQQDNLLQRADKHLAASTKKTQQDMLAQSPRRVGGAVPQSDSSPSIREYIGQARVANTITSSNLQVEGSPSRISKPPMPTSPRLLRARTSPRLFQVPQQRPSRGACSSSLTLPSGVGRTGGDNSSAGCRARSPSHDVGLSEAAVIQNLIDRKFLSCVPNHFDHAQTQWDANDLGHVQALCAAQFQQVQIVSVTRVENPTLDRVYSAIQGTMDDPQEMVLWHGTSPDCVHNIVVNGFNRAYSGRHGTKLGHGTYFAADATYSLRFCGRKSSTRKIMILAKVLVGSWTKGSSDLIEPPFRDAEQLLRYDATVDDVTNPSTFCVFRDYQAVPRYIVEFAGLES